MNRASARGHSDIHHKAYRGPAHYYRDVTNEHATIHFSLGDVGRITGISAGVGFAVDRAYSALNKRSDFNLADGAFIAGTVAGTLAYYACYEFSHHYMHVIGQRRLSINRVLGNIIQGESDEKLRFSKPLLDDICNAVEVHVDTRVGKSQPSFSIDAALVRRLEEQIEYNRELGKATIALAENDGNQILASTAGEMLEREEKYRASLSLLKKPLYWLDRQVQRQLRASPVFQYVDNHHFVHHMQWLNNLNVVFPLMDVVARTKVDSSRAFLEENKQYWPCPNSAETAKFSIPELV